MNRNFFELLKARHEQGLRVCVGLDPDYQKIPDFVKTVIEQNRDTDLPIHADTFVRFCSAIISSTSDIVCAFKPNIAFFEALGPSGLVALKKIFLYIQINAPDVPIILDAKRGDIGNTNDGYVRSAFDFLSADAITLSPYMGKKSLEPFLKQKDKGCFILCRTSNEGADEFQNLIVQTNNGPMPMYEYVYEYVAKQVATEWNVNGNCGLVVGATAPTELACVRHTIGPNVTILLPGLGTQGGDIKLAIKASGPNIVANLSRSVLYASSGEDFAEAAQKEVERVNTEIHKWL